MPGAGLVLPGRRDARSPLAPGAEGSPAPEAAAGASRPEVVWQRSLPPHFRASGTMAAQAGREGRAVLSWARGA